MSPRLVLLFSIILLIFACRYKNQNKADLTILGTLNNDPALYFLGEIDSSVTTSCGTASPATTTATTQTGQTTPTQTTSSTTTNTRFSVFSQLVMKTKETLNIRFIYDVTQTQGRIDPQQGFILSGGLFGNTVSGTQGTVKWFNQGVNVDQSISGQQTLSFFNIEVNLLGTYTPGASSTNLNSCNTLDGVNCTSGQSATQCFTSDNRTCLVQSSSGTASVNIQGKLNCNAPNIVPQ
ncbi:LIC10920 family plasminogen-binding lipoprotein [Leptospira ryugenii]|uniref:LIC10920 family plasminogen-binding lipoprotein n=1 Tax=Leptospira ryugenii TaxID=1917863 RepID=UPI000D5969BC|nr:hypothetical protein [Leptospira ryugenii]